MGLFLCKAFCVQSANHYIVCVMEHGELIPRREARFVNRTIEYEIDSVCAGDVGHWEYCDTEPDEIWVEFMQRERSSEGWVFSRELLCAFFEHDAALAVGVGDVRFVPSMKPDTIGLHLSSDEGSIQLSLPRSQVESFLGETLHVCPNTDAARATAYEAAEFLLELEIQGWGKA